MDLYYRLSTHLIRIPPLRERKEDIPYLVEHLINNAARTMGKTPPLISREALNLLIHHPFPGNIRELKSYLADAVARAENGRIEEHLIAERLAGVQLVEQSSPGRSSSDLETLTGHFPTLEELADYAIREALRISDDNQSQAARLLGISRQALNKRLKKK